MIDPTTAPSPRYCRDCRYYGLNHHYLNDCSNPNLGDLTCVVTGKNTPMSMEAHWCRAIQSLCGVDGSWWEPKPVGAEAAKADGQQTAADEAAA